MENQEEAQFATPEGVSPAPETAQPQQAPETVQAPAPVPWRRTVATMWPS